MVSAMPRCAHCGRPFCVPPRRAAQRYCSRACLGRAQHARAGFLSFEQARAAVRAQRLGSRDHYHAWRREAQRTDLPSNPQSCYRDRWRGWSDWLGTPARRSQSRTLWAPFEEARARARARGFSRAADYCDAVRTGGTLADLPVRPDRAYRASGWAGWADYLGLEQRARHVGPWRPFVVARTHVRALGLPNFRAHEQWARSAERPRDIPAQPWDVYRGAGWAGFADYLGVTNRCTRQSLLLFLRGLLPHLSSLSAAEIAVLLREARIWPARWRNVSYAHTLRRLRTLASDADAVTVCASIVCELEAAAGAQPKPDRADALACAAPLAIDGDDVDETEDATARGAALAAPRAVHRVLDGVQHAADHAHEADGAVIAFFEAKALAKLWALVFRVHNAAPAIDEIVSYQGGDYAMRVRDRFIAEWNGAARVQPPAGYDFRIKGRLVQPNLMQRLLAYRLKEERRIGNWSAPGAGKTLGAILASRIVASRLTIVVAANNTLEGWEHEIRAAWPDSVVLVKEHGTITVDRAKHTYLLLNYEAFQQQASAQMVDRLVAEHQIDLVVLDEVHNIKQRGAAETKRRGVLADLLQRVGARNPGLYVLGMSATPVINSLDEGASLLAMVLGTSQDDLETTPTIANAIRLHERLVIHGVRYRPDYRQELKESTPAIDGTFLAQRIDALPRHRTLPLEQALLAAKLDAITAEARPGTVIYTHYVEGMVDPLRTRLEAAGLHVVEFTGRTKVGLELFKAQQADVLIGSATLREGIDGLQHVSNRVIVASLPWTHAAYEQLIGRFWRQGSQFGHIDVIVPQVVVGDGNDGWSWDRERMARVRYKKTLGDCALDGVIPEGVLESEQTMLQRSLDALHSWIARLEEAHVGGSGSTSR